MTIVGIPFYKNMGVQYTLTIMACLSALLVPVPYVFYKYGTHFSAPRGRTAANKDRSMDPIEVEVRSQRWKVRCAGS